ncbi:hypothetical protein ACIOD0_07815 [Kitasatospora albolonga]
MLWHAIAPVRRYTKVSHDVMRHPRLDSDAKVLIAYVQGLPEERNGLALSELAREVGIKGRKFQTAKDQLVMNGFVHERKVCGERGRWATLQVFSNVPLSEAEVVALWRDAGAVPGTSPSARFPTVGEPGSRTVGHQLPVGEERGEDHSHPPTEGPGSESDVEPASAEVLEAERVLLSLRHSHRSLHLGVAEARGLVSQAVEWLRRGVSGGELRRVLTSDLPEGGVRSAVGFLRYRLERKMPEAPEASEASERREPELSFREAVPSGAGPVVPASAGSASVGSASVGSPWEPTTPYIPPPLVTCEGPGTEHVFRAGFGETVCPDCQQAAAWARWAERRAADLGVDLAEEAAAAAEAGRDPNGWRARLAAAVASGAGGGAGDQ